MGDGSDEKAGVGYGRPPVEHRFKKGRSGNPAGRPKGARNATPSGESFEFGTEPASRMLLEEAYRTVSIREGDKVIKLPVIKAVFRSLGVSAMKGSRLAQTALAELVQAIEGADRRLRGEHLEAACEYKMDWTRAIEEARRLGIPEPQPLPHPDDVIIDVRRSDVRYAGPMTPEEKVRWDRGLAFRDEQQELVSITAELYRKARKRDVARREQRLKSWRQEVEFYDRLNNVLPDRYRKQLVDRCYVKSAAEQPTAGSRAVDSNKEESRC